MKAIKNKLLKNEELMTQLKSLASSYQANAKTFKNEHMLSAIEAADYYHMRKPIAATTGGARSVAPVVKSKVDDAHIQIMDIISKLKEGTKVKPKDFGTVFPPQMSAHIINLVEETIWARCGSKILDSAVKDALLCGTSALRWYVEEEPVHTIELFQDLNKLELEIMKSNVLPNQKLEITEEKSVDVPKDFQLGNKLYSGRITTTNKKKIVKYKHIPFNSFYVDGKATSIADAKYVCVETFTSRAELIAQGYDKATVMDAHSEGDYNYKAYVDSDTTYTNFSMLGTNYIDKTMDEVVVKEIWLKTTLIGDSYGLYRLVMIGSTILDVVAEDTIPLAELIPVANVSTFWGVSYAYQLRAQQDIETAIKRGYIDNIHNANHGRMMGLKGQYNKRDAMDNRPNGIVEIEVMGALSPFPYNQLPAGIDNLLAWNAADADNISGISNEMLGRSDAVWNSNVAASTTAMNYSKGDFTIKNYAQGIIFGIQSLAKGIYEEWSKIIELPPIHAFSISFETETGKKAKAMDAVQQYQLIAQTPFNTPQLQAELIKEVLLNSSKASLIQFLKPVEQVLQEQQQPNPTQQLQQALIQEQIQNLQADTKLKLQKADIDADVAASEQNRSDTELQFQMEMEAQKLNLADRKQTNEEFKTTIEAELAQKELQQKSLALVYETRYKDLFNAGEIVGTDVSNNIG